MNPIIQFSEDGGELALKAVPGSLAVKPNPENEVEAAEGLDRSMFVCAQERLPASQAVPGALCVSRRCRP